MPEIYISIDTSDSQDKSKLDLSGLSEGVVSVNFSPELNIGSRRCMVIVAYLNFWERKSKSIDSRRDEYLAIHCDQILASKYI
jgi:hypothetical protein